MCKEERHKYSVHSSNFSFKSDNQSFSQLAVFVKHSGRECYLCVGQWEDEGTAWVVLGSLLLRLCNLITQNMITAI